METVTARKVKKILVVEDDVNLNKLISYNLLKNEYMVESAYDGILAKEKLSKDVFDVVILDIMLPGIDGFQLCELIKKKNSAIRNTNVVILTAKAEPLDKIYGCIIGADYYLTKPFSIAKLMLIIREITILREKDVIVETGIGHDKNN